MKRIISIIIFTLSSGLAVLSQTSENPCPKIKINAPETVQAGNKFTVSASFESEKQPSESKFNWVVINEDKVSRINGQGIINVESKNLRDLITIIILAENLESKCQSPAIAKVFSIPNVGSPYIIDEFQKLSWNNEKARLDSAVSQMQEMTDMKLLAYLYFDKKDSQTQRKNYLVNFLTFVSGNKKLEKNRIIFLISESDEKTVRFQPVPINFFDYHIYCNDCLIIRGEDFDKLNNLFQSKSTSGKRKQ